MASVIRGSHTATGGISGLTLNMIQGQMWLRFVWVRQQNTSGMRMD
jgi:hypothetical protein